MYEVEAGRKAQMDPIEVPVLRPAANGNAIPARGQGPSDQAAIIGDSGQSHVDDEGLISLGYCGGETVLLPSAMTETDVGSLEKRNHIHTEKRVTAV